MTTASDARWAELESRAGASGQNRMAWLEERRRGITATQVRDLAMASDLGAAIAALVREKVLGLDVQLRMPVIRWGNEREPIIAAEAEAIYGYRHETRVFRSASNPRWLASPDGLRVDPDGTPSLLEIKTAGWPLDEDSVRQKGYYDQCQWQMLVLDSDRCLLMWEERIEGEHGFEPGVTGSIPIRANAARQLELAEIADKFLVALDDALENGLPEAADEDPLLSTLVADLLILRRRVDDAEQYLREYLDAKAIKGAKTEMWTLSYTFGKGRRSFNKVAFEADFPGAYEKYLTPGAPPEKATLRITKKGEREEG